LPSLLDITYRHPLMPGWGLDLYPHLG